ncbi:MAG: EI24 domain-containing protein [Planctomycetota bacterium]|nr:EI24 domain-containing protein [Planctomycetota bacterium]
MTTSDLPQPAGSPVGGPVPSTTPPTMPTGAGEPLTPQEALRQKRQADACERAAHALGAPIAPERGVRCPRCGERLCAKGDPVPATCGRCGVEVKSARAGELLVPSAAWTRELLRGAAYLPRGFFRLLRSPSLWKWAVVPLILNIIALSAAFTLAYFINRWLGINTGPGSLGSWKDAGGLWWALSYVVQALGWVASWLVWFALPLISTWLIVAFPFGIIYKLVFMPFMELLTESTERVVLGFDENADFDFKRMYVNLILAVIGAIALTLLQGALYLLLLPINVLPFLGSLLWVILPPAIFAGMDYTDINLVRRRYSLREKVRLWRTHEWRFLGYGISFFFLITMPVINIVAIPCAAVGGALLYLELDRK